MNFSTVNRIIENDEEKNAKKLLPISRIKPSSAVVYFIITHSL